jgi:hypothetical protein
MVAIYFYPYQEINVPLFYISQMLSSIGMATAAVIGVVAGLGAQSKIVALAPAFLSCSAPKSGSRSSKRVDLAVPDYGQDHVRRGETWQSPSIA